LSDSPHDCPARVQRIQREQEFGTEPGHSRVTISRRVARGQSRADTGKASSARPAGDPGGPRRGLGSSLRPDEVDARMLGMLLAGDKDAAKRRGRDAR
jgi:hypothetical protein